MCTRAKDLTIREFVQFLQIAFGEDSNSVWGGVGRLTNPSGTIGVIGQHDDTSLIFSSL